MICPVCDVSLEAMAADGWKHEATPPDANGVERHRFVQVVTFSKFGDVHDAEFREGWVSFRVEFSAVRHPTIDAKYFGGRACFGATAEPIRVPKGAEPYAVTISGGYGSITNLFYMFLVPGGLERLEPDGWKLRERPSRLHRYALRLMEIASHG